MKGKTPFNNTENAISFNSRKCVELLMNSGLSVMSLNKAQKINLKTEIRPNFARYSRNSGRSIYDDYFLRTKPETIL